ASVCAWAGGGKNRREEERRRMLRTIPGRAMARPGGSLALAGGAGHQGGAQEGGHQEEGLGAGDVDAAHARQHVHRDLVALLVGVDGRRRGDLELEGGLVVVPAVLVRRRDQETYGLGEVGAAGLLRGADDEGCRG